MNEEKVDLCQHDMRDHSFLRTPKMAGEGNSSKISAPITLIRRESKIIIEYAERKHEISNIIRRQVSAQLFQR